eukprot:11727326-Heterocapsa_arctica.AAC.1
MDRVEEVNATYMDAGMIENSAEELCEYIVWDLQMAVFADKIGQMTCTPTELIYCKSGLVWWRVCNDTHCYRCEIISKAELRQSVPTETNGRA